MHYIPDTIKSSEYAKNQITLHLISTYYLNASGNLTRETAVIANNDLVHDNLAVSLFRKHLVNHLRTKKNISLNQLVKWSDVSSSQYKSVYALQRQLEDSMELDLTITKHTFRFEHGKGENDVGTGVTK